MKKESDMKCATLIAMAMAGMLAIAPVSAQKSAATDKGTPAPLRAPNTDAFDKQTAQVQESIRKMQEQMDKLRQTQNPQERQRLLQEHWTTMQSGMGLMHGMWTPELMGGHMMMGGPMMGGSMMGWRSMRGYYSNLTPEQIRQRQYMMDQYVGMQHQMMNHMMMHQNYMSLQPPLPSR